MKNIIEIIKIDFQSNHYNFEVCTFLLFFRLGYYFKIVSKQYKYGILFSPFSLVTYVIYKLLSLIYVMEIPLGTEIGEGITIHHLKGIVVNSDAQIGKFVTLGHFITIAGQIIIHDNVVINPQSVIVNGVIHHNAVVGAGSVVTKDVAENTIVAGSPAKVIGTKNL